MQQCDLDWWNETRTGRALLFAFFVGVVLFFATAIFLVLHALTRWPTWLQVVIALPAGLLSFISWAKAHETNGCDGVVRSESPTDDPDRDRGGPTAE
jgi:uncharacterized protein (DUF983 family)